MKMTPYTHKMLIIVLTIFLRYLLFFGLSPTPRVAFLAFFIPALYILIFLIRYFSGRKTKQKKAEIQKEPAEILIKNKAEIIKTYKDLFVMTIIIGIGINFYDGWPAKDMELNQLMLNFIIGSLSWSLISFAKTALGFR